jgi:hypothetical protein
VLPPLAPMTPASCMLASCVPPEPPAELPPEPERPPVAGAPPAAEIPPRPGCPPLAGAPPTPEPPPVPGCPPLAVAPPAPEPPPVPDRPPIVDVPPVAELPPGEETPPIPPPDPLRPVDGVLLPPQDGRLTTRPDTIIPSRIFFIREPPSSSRRDQLSHSK